MITCAVCGGSFASIGTTHDDAGHNWLACAVTNGPKYREALSAIVEQVKIAEDPEHHTLSLVGKIAEQALAK